MPGQMRIAPATFRPCRCTPWIRARLPTAWAAPSGNKQRSLPRRLDRRTRTAGGLLAGGLCLAPALASGSGVPSASSQAALRNQAIQALERGDLRRGCPLLRRAIDQTGALVARKPSPACARGSERGVGSAAVG